MSFCCDRGEMKDFKRMIFESKADGLTTDEIWAKSESSNLNLKNRTIHYFDDKFKVFNKQYNTLLRLRKKLNDKNKNQPK